MRPYPGRDRLGMILWHTSTTDYRVVDECLKTLLIFLVQKFRFFKGL
jgi:hypothetical protein